jgi:hypothetical protein
MAPEAIKEEPYHEREIAAIITGITNTQPDLVRFYIFNLEPMIILFKLHGGKRFLLTSWKSMVEAYALRNPVMFEIAAHHIRLRLSAPDLDDYKYWFGHGRINPTFPMFVNRDGKKEIVLTPMECCMGIVIDPFFDRLKHLLEGEH